MSLLICRIRVCIKRYSSLVEVERSLWKFGSEKLALDLQCYDSAAVVTLEFTCADKNVGILMDDLYTLFSCTHVIWAVRRYVLVI